MMEEIRSSETSVPTRATLRNIQVDRILCYNVILSATKATLPKVPHARYLGLQDVKHKTSGLELPPVSSRSDFFGFVIKRALDHSLDNN
jgi:hypothetical protein